MDATAHFDQHISGVRRANSNESVESNENDNIDDNNEYMPTVRILGERTRHFPNLGIDRNILRIQFVDPPEMGNMEIRAYNRVLSNWLHRALKVSIV